MMKQLIWLLSLIPYSNPFCIRLDYQMMEKYVFGFGTQDA
jgi:hypothetical protein